MKKFPLHLSTYTLASVLNVCHLAISVGITRVMLDDFMNIRIRLMFVSPDFYAAFYHTIFIIPAWGSRLSVLTAGFGSGQLKRVKPIALKLAMSLIIHTIYTTQISPNATDIFDLWVFRRAEKCAAPSLVSLVMGFTLHACDSETRELLASPPFICRVKHRMNIHRSGSIWQVTHCLQSEKKNTIKMLFFFWRKVN